MKKVVLLSLFNFFTVLIIHAQIQPEKPFFPRRFDTSYKRHMLIDSFREQLFQNNQPYAYRMPVAGAMPKKFVYVGNNGKGFDLYQTMQDNMYILRPDSTFLSNMPVIKTPAGKGKKD